MILKVKTSNRLLPPCYQNDMSIFQRWSRGPKARGQGQGHKKNPRPRSRTTFLRTNHLETKDRNARGQHQGHKRKCSKKKVFKKNFLGDLQKKVFKIFFKRSLKEENKKGLRKFFARFLAFANQILTIQKVLSSSRGQGNFRGLETSRRRI